MDDSIKQSWMSRVGLVVIAALLVELISIVQFNRIRRIIGDEMTHRSRVVLGGMADRIGHTLEMTEITMKENAWAVRRSFEHPDSVMASMVYLIDDNPHVVGGCIAFIPDFYPSTGSLYEPYASKENGQIRVRQIAGPDHDYTQNIYYQKVLETGVPMWSEAYTYGEDSLMSLTTYSYPFKDAKGRVVAVCGLDMDLSWLGDTLNAHQRFPSSFSFLLDQNGKLLSTPPRSRATDDDVRTALQVLESGSLESKDKKVGVRSFTMEREPYWQIVQVYKTDEVFADMRKVRRQQVLLILLGLLFLFFVIERFARNARKLRVTSEEKARMDGELAVSRNIQMEMLPKTFTPDVYGAVEPAREVGGDLFDFFLRDGKLFFCVGDVSGKGVPSAMLMSVIHSLFRMVSQREPRPSHILKELNGELCRGNDSNMFVTFFAGCLDLYTGVLQFSNAGHDKPFLVSESVSLLSAVPNLPLGVFPDTEFVEQTCTLSPGDVLVLYTDGLTEAKNLSRSAFGRPGVSFVLEKCLSRKDVLPEHLVSSLTQAVHLFAGEAPQSDDLTVLAVRFNPQNIISEQITLTNDREEITRFTPFVKGFFDKLELDRKTASSLRLALEEMVVNVINYAYPGGESGSLLVRADSNRKEVRFTLEDSGIPFDPTTVLSADTKLDALNRPIGGLGIFLARKIMDSVSYCRESGKNVLTLTKSIC